MTQLFTVKDFNAIASGKYNAGFVDLQTGSDGTVKLANANHHVHLTYKNRKILSPEKILSVKESFINALQAQGVSAENIGTIRRSLGLSPEIRAGSSDAANEKTICDRMAPLSRRAVRIILDRYVYGGVNANLVAGNAFEELTARERRAVERTRGMPESRKAYRREVNREGRRLMAGLKDRELGNVLSLLSSGHALSRVNQSRSSAVTGANAVNEQSQKTAALVSQFTSLFHEAMKFQDPRVTESSPFMLCSQRISLVRDSQGQIAALMGDGALKTRITLDAVPDTLMRDLITSSVRDRDTLGRDNLKLLLDKVYAQDLDGLLTGADRTSLTRYFAVEILKQSFPNQDFSDIMTGNYNTAFLHEIAVKVLNGELDGRDQILKYHNELVTNNTGLSEEMKAMLSEVAQMPLVHPDGTDGFEVTAKLAADINGVIPACPPFPSVTRDVSLDEVKNFVADLMFSDDTMVAEAADSNPGEAMHRILSDEKNIHAFAAVMRDPELLNGAVAPELLAVVKEGFQKIRTVIEPLFTKATGKSLASDPEDRSFVPAFTAFVRDRAKLPNIELTKITPILLSTAAKGCDQIQSFINRVFKIEGGNKNEQGGLTTDPYRSKSPDEIRRELQSRKLNEIIDSANTDGSAPGQVGLFKQVMSEYFTNMAMSDKRAVFASALRYSETFDFRDPNGAPLTDKALESARKHATATFTGAILKGTGPLMQKMMQGVSRGIMGDFDEALNDMKSNLAPISRKIVQAHLNKVIADSQGKITAIKMNHSLGAASVGEVFLCTVKYQENGEEKSRDVVIKIMRHDAEARMKHEAELFNQAAAKIGPGMVSTWKGQLEQYMTEFDFKKEADNTREGQKIYQIQGNYDHYLNGMAPTVASMKLADDLIPAGKNLMAVELVQGDNLDRLFSQQCRKLQGDLAPVFERDPATGRLIWDPQTGYPVMKKGCSVSDLHLAEKDLGRDYIAIQKVQHHLITMAKVWCTEALLHSGKFHGDCHSGNMMIGKNSSNSTFIDFGNLYTLKKDGNTDERKEVLKLIMGAALRSPKLLLDSFATLLSPEGRTALEANREKAEAIVECLMDKGELSYDAVYRLQGCLSELQKLGLELPPQINCFVQSLARIQNAVTEMNIVLNRCIRAREAIQNMDLKPGERDELDLLGKLSDAVRQKDGRQPEKGGAPGTPAWKEQHILSKLKAENVTEVSKLSTFSPEGEFCRKLTERISSSTDQAGEVRKLTAMLLANLGKQDSEARDMINAATEDFISVHASTQSTPEEKKAATDSYVRAHAAAVAGTMQKIKNSDDTLYLERMRSMTHPATFASVVMSTLFALSDATQNMMKDSFKTNMGDLLAAYNGIASRDLHLGIFERLSQDKVTAALQNNVNSMGGDQSYQLDIGI